ncbi:MAG: sulfurtransferase [Rhodobacteraceae bacterium]|nr:sulfurtransferase [Paracoccaceae bacterium]
MFNFLKSAPRLTAADAVARAKAGELIVIDVRDIAEIKATGRAAGSLHIPLMTLQMKCDPSSPECLAELKSGKPIALYCASGGRSQMAAQMMAQLGYAEVHNIGGFFDWQAAGGAVAR